MNHPSPGLPRQVAGLSEQLKTTNTLIAQLGKLTFQPGSEPLGGEGGVRVELTQDIHESLKQLTEDFEIIKQEAADLHPDGRFHTRANRKDNEEARLSAKVIRIGEDLKEARQRFRTAQVSAKYASEQAKRKERQALLESYRREAAQLDQATEPVQSSRDQLFAQRRQNQTQKNLTRDEVLVNASSDVTAALRRTHDLLSSELTRSRFAQETFDESTAALAQLGDDYSSLDDILSTSRNLIGTLLKSQKSDSWYLETAFYILIATLCWLVFRRLLYGPFIKLPLFFWRVFTFFISWGIFKPLYLFLSITGVVTTERRSGASADLTSSSRPPLIVQPSAQGGIGAIPSVALPKGGIPAGAGGVGAKRNREPILEGTMSEQIGKMTEDQAEPEKAPKAQEDGKELPRRGDGTVLQERGDVPPNPKKKAFEADAEDEKHESRKRDEL
ncbi:Sec20-domain-containing protein [Dissoconium aciculare CBS 342.82]|uniref:Sec20-domain-containing protein n=1 Tax=Dissoconium aciculare CBS 342.82 TaxID=1314786 RepID=A0A6J3LXK5_9PEZI|nr:Sec20-domain-containing protein [Dissoconium aciculare CBS 342.82]KAF1819367.1 Sec20-domain-containing protein [Dissoconium aciculare CBS 342.82]